MDIIFQIIFGGYFGWMASGQLRGNLLCVALGILGAMLASLFMNLFSRPGVTGYNFYSFLVAMGGAVLIIFLGRSFYVFLRKSRFLTERRLASR